MKKKDTAGTITGIVAILATAAFFLLGFTTGKWYIIWIVFLAIPLTTLIAKLIVKDNTDS